MKTSAYNNAGMYKLKCSYYKFNIGKTNRNLKLHTKSTSLK